METESAEATAASRSSVRRPILILAALAAGLGAAAALRAWLGIEWSAESLRETVASAGPWAPLGFVSLVAFRQLFALPSVLVLTSAGLLFGVGLGTLVGGVGMAVNACLVFSTARLMGRDWVQARIHSRWPRWEERSRRAGPPFIALMTGHPMGVLTPFHFAAGVSGIGWLAFLAAVVPTAPLRAACYSFLGANLLDPLSPRLWIATLVLLVVALLPFAHPRVRRRFQYR
jgi:uncharacterized membrane protein YdjX (TVP38/TMEM64 family)